MQFEKISSQHSGINFNNTIVEDTVHNFFNFAYIYNGGGVAVGDINNDGLVDIYFSGNQVANRLYLNQGNFRFIDITDSAFPRQKDDWSNGVTMIDINNDGWLDIYVSRSGLYRNSADRENQLFINNGDLTFSEEAEKFGLNDPGFSTQAYFLDYDRDNDLDMFLVNHRYDFENNNSVIPRNQISYDKFSSDHLYQNNGNGYFSNVTKESGIINYAWGLSAAIGDFNNDGWNDIYIANDYVEPDNLYINQQDGTFAESIAKLVKHTSYYSMGSDFADINNDGFDDLIVLDMVPEDHVRAKRLMAPMSTENFWRLIASGLHYQYMLNTLQLNQGNGLYSEIAQLSGVSKTDWSWAPLFADFDNDGYQDLFITNGIKRDITDNDFFNQLNSLSKSSTKPIKFNEIIANMPTAKLQNYLYRNQGNLTFRQINEQSHLTDLSNSNGAAYADLDNDGDLDLVVNNLDENASLYRNSTPKGTVNFLKIQLKGPGQNALGIGARVSIRYDSGKQVKNQNLGRGFLSSVSPILHFGLGQKKTVNSVSVRWSDGKISTVDKVRINETLVVGYEDSQPPSIKHPVGQKLLSEITHETAINYQHKENPYNDFKKEVLLPHKQSEHGPFISVGDVNGDTFDDFFIGGAAGRPGVLFLQTAEQQFNPGNSQPWIAEAESEDLGSLFFDADNDKDLDLYVISGSNEFDKSSHKYRDRLYINDGAANFRKSDTLPNATTSGQRVVPGDYDQDGDVDLLIGGRSVPGQYPQTPNSFLLNNDQGKLTDVTQQLIPELSTIGMVTDGQFIDFDKDGDLDLILVGEWMPITVFDNQQDHYVNVTKQLGLSNTHGWWQSIEYGDLDQDGDLDFVAGNIGGNNKFHPSHENPLTLYANDFDGNGSLDIVLATKKQKNELPIRGRQCSAEQMPNLANKFPTFKAFAEADLATIYDPNKLAEAQILKADLFESVLVINENKKGFRIQPLASTAQISPISAILVKDFNNDHYPDILFTGNMYATEVETVRYDAGIGGLLLGDGKLGFEAAAPALSGFITPGNARDLKTIRLAGNQQDSVLVSNNNDRIQVFTLQK